MTDALRPAVVFPSASRRGGVERIAWEALHYLGARHDTAFVGSHLDDHDSPHVRFLQVPATPWARRGLTPVGFRRASSEVTRSLHDRVTISLGVNAAPGDVYVVNSVHRAWLAVGKSVRLHGVPVPNRFRYALPRHLALLALERDYFCRHRPRAIVAVSSVVLDDLAEIYRVKDVPSYVIPNGFDAQRCNAARRESLRAEQRTSLGIGRDAIVALFVANELHRKGLGVLLRAVARVRDPRLEVHVVGRTPLDDYQPQIEALGLADQVRYHGATDDIGLAHAFADLLVLPTQYEAFALTIVEALASGLPVITTKVPGAGDLVSPGENGLLQDDPLDAEELASLLSDALDDARRARWSRAAPDAAMGYDWTSLMARLERVLVDVT